MKVFSEKVFQHSGSPTYIVNCMLDCHLINCLFVCACVCVCVPVAHVGYTCVQSLCGSCIFMLEGALDSL